MAPREELDGAGGHGHEDDQDDGPSAETAQQQRPGREDHGESQSEEPDIKGIAAPPHQNPLETMGGIADGPGQQAGKDQNRENLEGDPAHIDPEMHVTGGSDHRNDHRNEEGGRHVDKAHIAHRRGKVAVQLLGDDPGGCGRGADEAEHGAFQQDAEGAVGSHGTAQGEKQEPGDLDGERPQVPALQAQVVRGNLDELEKQQQGDDEPLPFGCDHMERPAPGLQKAGIMVQQVQADSQHDGNREQPVLEKLKKLIHLHGRGKAGRSAGPSVSCSCPSGPSESGFLPG